VRSAIILAVATLFLAMGVYGLTAPAALVRPFGITLPSAEARSEVRAVYGGFGVAVALVLTLSGFDVGGVRTGSVTAVAAALLGMAAGRLVARATEAPRAFYPVWFYFWIEIAGAALLLLAIWA
jgi:hypothetical protein